MKIDIETIKRAVVGIDTGKSQVMIDEGELSLTRDSYDPFNGQLSKQTLTESVESLQKRKADLEAAAAADLEAAAAIGKLLNQKHKT